MRTSDFHFNLPEELIAQSPAPQRDQSRLLVLHRVSGRLDHTSFPDIQAFLRPGDVLVLNDTRVIPARLRGTNPRTGGKFEILLVEENDTNDWWAMMRPGKRARVGTGIAITGRDADTGITATVIETNDEGHRRLRFRGTPDIAKALELLGEVPLPPYIHRDTPPGDADRERYQTVYAHRMGSVAAPTAGLHFTEALLDRIRSQGVQVCFTTLHVGLGTFAPVKTEDLAAHRMHEERYELSPAGAEMITAAKREGRRVIAVGTTSVRVLETLAADPGGIRPGSGRTSIFIYPPYRFKVVDALLTNFHLPCSTLLMLASAFADPGGLRGRDLILSAYAEAIRAR
ncbi:MAG TPA: tRNA preQ1(34) S-adenosylmethionine ribosyltransferase-isomerase QueA, partial [Verrucomicrobiota bacterium]|nr:tRNA preQ1(34) S-adenosylmethionine ribosyltransferase-isomerase QueA [Verrucomicrobiota bacterium]